MKQWTNQISLDFRSGTPIYVQLVDQIRKMIIDRELIPGDQLPTVRQLATDLRVNWNTVARAYRILDEAGLISTQQGRGTYVWEKPSPEVVHELRQQGLKGLTQNYISEAAGLGFSPEEVYLAVEAQIKAWQEEKLSKENSSEERQEK